MNAQVELNQYMQRLTEINGHSVKIIEHSNGQDWYCAKDVVEAAGTVWNGASQALKKIPEHHKAILQLKTEGGIQNLWCISKCGIKKPNPEYDPLCSCAQSCTKHNGVMRKSALFDREGEPIYKNILAAAKKQPTPILIMHLLDETGVNKETEELISRLNEEGQKQICDYRKSLEKLDKINWSDIRTRYAESINREL